MDSLDVTIFSVSLPNCADGGVANVCLRQVQKKTLEDESIKEIVHAVKRQLKAKKSFSLVCGRCKSVRVAGDKIRTINNAHHVVIGQQLKQQVICRRNPTRRIDDVDFTGSLICGKPGCGSGLGQMLNYMGVRAFDIVTGTIRHSECSQMASYFPHFVFCFVDMITTFVSFHHTVYRHSWRVTSPVSSFIH